MLLFKNLLFMRNIFTCIINLYEVLDILKGNEQGYLR